MLNKLDSQSLLEQIGDTQSSSLAIKDLEHRFVYVNESFATKIGRKCDEVIGKNDLELGRPESLVLGDPSINWPGLWELEKQVIEAGCKHTNAEATHMLRNNTTTRRTPLRDATGEIVGLMIQLHENDEALNLHIPDPNNKKTQWLQKAESDTFDVVLAELSSCHNTQSLFDRLVDTIVEKTSADGAYIAKVHESGDFIEFVSFSGIKPEFRAGTRRHLGHGLIGEIWERGEAAFVSDLGNDNFNYDWEPHTQAFVLPLIVDGETVAVLSTVSTPSSPDLAQDIHLLQRISRIATFGITNTLFMDESSERISRTRALGELSRLLNTVENATDACDAVCRVLLPAFDATRASSFLVDKNGKFSSHVSWCMANGEVQPAATIPAELATSCIAYWSVVNSETAVIKRYEEDPRECKEIHEAREKLNIGSTCSVPLYISGKPAGTLLISRDRDRLDFDENDITAFSTIINQLSSALERHELANQLQHQAFHDRLTTLPNRHHFELELDNALKIANENGSTVSVLFMDLDGFKDVNDTLGHAAGDLLLSLVSERLRGCINSSDMLARMGGDEFAVIVCNNDSADSAHLIAKRILLKLSTPVSMVGQSVKVGASIGISQYPKDGLSGDEILRCADTAMYQAKYSGKGQILDFDKNLAEDARDRNKIEAELRNAIDNKEFKLLYQPQVRCTDNQVVGVEALIRWEHPSRGLVSPAEFIPLAENIGLINAIGAWVIDESIRQLAVWQGTSLRKLRVSINIAASQFQMEDFTDQVLNALTQHQVPANLLELEVTESVVMNDMSSVVERLYRLREAGVRVAIDDFGTGYSSLSYLQDLPLDVLKIDRTFVSRLACESGEQSLVKTIQLLASGLGLETVAEGVESLEQKDAVEELGCDLIQGFLHSRPVAADEIPHAVEGIESRDVQDLDGSRAA